MSDPTSKGTGSGAIANVMSGDNTTGHVTTATIAGGAAAELILWLLSLFPATAAHPPPEVAVGVICTIVVSQIMQKF